MGLGSRRQALLAALGHPEAAFPVIHIAGTNGKGSTAAMIAQGLHAAGYRVGRFTSPDLHGPHERFWLSGAVLAPGDYAARYEAVAEVAERVALEFPELQPWRPFELWCAIAWEYFREQTVDVAVVECGMGGAHDATNVLPTKVLTLITAIGLDHALCWGGDLASVVREKAGIMRPGVPVMTTATGESLPGLEQAALQTGAPLTVVSPLSGERKTDGHHHVTLNGQDTRLALGGQFQLENAALAVAGLQQLAADGWQISEDAVLSGIRDVTWPGRLETLVDPEGGTWVLDGAHNPEAVRALVEAWEPPAVLIAAIQKSKDAPAMIRELSRGGRPLVLLTLPDAEYWNPADLASWAEGPVHVARDVTDALHLARTLAPQGRRGIAGSIYLVAACRDILRRGDAGVDSGASRVHQV